MLATYQEMNEAANKMRNAANEYQSGVDTLYEKIDNLSMNWKGGDNQAYVETTNSYKKDMKDLGEIIKQYATFLEKSAQFISATQEDVQNDAGRL